MNIKILNLFFLISVQFVCAQISGTIIEFDESLPLDYATAALFHEEDNRLQTGVITNQEGFFEIKKIPNGRYYLELSFIGYSTKTVKNLELSKTTLDIKVSEFLEITEPSLLSLRHGHIKRIPSCTSAVSASSIKVLVNCKLILISTKGFKSPRL